MPIPSYTYLLEHPVLSLDYQTAEILNELYPSNISYFNSGSSLPAGQYTIRYKKGTVKYNVSDSDKYKLNCVVNNGASDFTKVDILDGEYTKATYKYYDDGVSEVGFVVCFNDGSGSLINKRLCPGSISAQTNFVDSVSLNMAESDVTITHNGGPIGIYFHAIGSSVSATSEDGGPSFILIRTDNTPAECVCGTTYNIYHLKQDNTLSLSNTYHIKRAGNNTFKLSYTSDVSPLNVSMRILYGINVIVDWTSTLSGITDNNLPTLSSNPFTIDDEVVTVEFKHTGNSYDVLNFNFSITQPAAPTISAPTNLVGPSGVNLTSDVVEFEWTNVTNSVNNIIYGYDIFLAPSEDSFDETNLIATVLNNNDVTQSISALIDPGITYHWGIRSISSITVSDPTSNDDTFRLANVTITDSYVRISPVSNKIDSVYKVAWQQDSDEILAFKISGCISKYINNECVFDWVPICKISKTEETSYYINIDIKHGSDYYQPENSNLILCGGGLILDNDYNGSALITNLNHDDLRKINLKLDHYELWFKVEALTVKTIISDTKYILIGCSYSEDPNRSSPNSGTVTTLSTKTQFFDYLIDNPVYDNENLFPVKHEFDLIWATKKPKTSNGTPLFSDCSRTAIDISAKQYNRKLSGWVTYRQNMGGTEKGEPGACIRYNLETGEPQQIYYNFAATVYGYRPRGTAVNNITGECVAGGGESDITTYSLCSMKYKDVNNFINIESINTTSNIITTTTDHNLSAGNAVEFVSDGTLPTGIIENATYFVRSNDLTNRQFKITSTYGGSELDISGIQSGNHSVKKIIFINLATPNSNYFTSLGSNLGRCYGSVYDKFGRLWTTNQNNLVCCINQNGTKATVGNISTKSIYGICIDYYGNIWGTSHVNSGHLYRVAINPSTGAISQSYNDYNIGNGADGGLCADLPNTNNSFNIWTGSFTKKLIKTNFTYNQNNNTVSYNSSSYLDLTNVVYSESQIEQSSRRSCVWGAGFTSDNDIIVTTYNTKDVLKIYQKENNSSWPNGGFFRYNDKQLSDSDRINTTGNRYNIAPMGPRIENDSAHPMWHKCYDIYDTNFSYTLTKLNRYRAWKFLSGLYYNGQNLETFGCVLSDLSNTILPTNFTFPLRKYPHYGPVGTNDSINGINRSGNGFTINCLYNSTIGYYSRFRYSTNAELIEGGTVDLSSFQMYIYSDFIGGVGTLSNPNYPISNVDIQYPPLISHTIQTT